MKSFLISFILISLPLVALDYEFFDENTNLISHDVRQDILAALKKDGVPSRMDGVYRDASRLQTRIFMPRDVEGNFTIRRDENNSVVFDRAAEALLKKIPQERLKNVKLVSIEFTAFDIFNQISHENLVENFEKFQRPALTWHQDKFGPRSGFGHFSFLYFSILETMGLTDHDLLVGKIPEKTLHPSSGLGNAWYVENADDVHSIVKSSSVSGSGYWIDQDYRDDLQNLVVHSHSPYELRDTRPLITPTRTTLVGRVFLLDTSW